jgi:3-oxoacyl-[acyl-carrier protein] reductase
VGQLNVPAALVTGASRRGGIAAAVVEALRRDGWEVATTGWRAYDASEPWGSEPGEADALGRGTFIEADLSDPEAPAAVLAAAEDALGPLTALVVLHTESRFGGVLDTEAADFDRHLAVNARSALLLAAEFARRFRGEAGSGRIVAFTSGAVHGEVAYGASKGALERIVVAAAAELGPLGISVNAVDPGPSDTGWISPELREVFEQGTPLGRVGQPQDAAELVAFLCSPRGGWITGQVITSDGGWSVRSATRRARTPVE